jgi:T4 superinfection immunity protein
MAGLSLGTLIIILLLLAVHFLPSVIAFKRRHHNRIAILVLNVLLGWTFIGWVVALVWACMAVRSAGTNVTGA